MKKLIILILAILIAEIRTYAQVSINNDNGAPEPSAIMDLKSTNKGFLPPRMTTGQQNAIVSPIAGLIIFNTDSQTLNLYSGSAWVPL